MILTDGEGIWMEKWFVAMKKADFNAILSVERKTEAK